jgi:hypothetical protein
VEPARVFELSWQSTRRILTRYDQKENAMPIQGLSNQWKTYEGLIHLFAEIRGEDTQCPAEQQNRMIRHFLETLHAKPGPTIYVGTSHSLMNFSTRDVNSIHDRTQPFAYVSIVSKSASLDDHMFRIETRDVVDDRPTGNWIIQHTSDVHAAVALLVDSLAYADIPQRQKRGP